MKKYKNGIFIGKFYPLHFAHISAINTLNCLCENTYVIFYNNIDVEERLSNQCGYKYNIDSRMDDARKIFKSNKNIIIEKIDIPSGSVFPDNYNLIKNIISDIVKGSIDVQIFGCDEAEIYEPYKYAKDYILASIYSIEDKNNEIISLHSTLIRKDFEFYKNHLPNIIRENIINLKKR